MHIPTDQYIAVDLDGTLVESNTAFILFETMVQAKPVEACIMILSYFMFGPNEYAFSQSRLHLDEFYEKAHSNEKLRFNINLIEFLKKLKNLGKYLILATGSDEHIGQAIGAAVSKYFGLIFDKIIGSVPGFWCIAHNKLKALKEITSKFTYIGNSNQDYPIWMEEGIDMICVGDETFSNNASIICKKKPIMIFPGEFC